MLWRCWFIIGEEDKVPIKDFNTEGLMPEKGEYVRFKNLREIIYDLCRYYASARR